MMDKHEFGKASLSDDRSCLVYMINRILHLCSFLMIFIKFSNFSICLPSRARYKLLNKLNP